MPTTVTRYVNTASTAGGDGTTNATAGANRAYASLSEAETAEQKDLVSADEALIIECCGSTPDTTVLINGFTTDATRNITIRGNRSDPTGFNTSGVYSNSFYAIEGSSTTLPFQCLDNYVTLDGVQIAIRGSSDTGIVSVSSSNTTFALRNNILLSATTGLISSNAAVQINADGSIVENNIIYCTGSPGVYHGLSVNNDITSGRIYNNTIYGWNRGITNSSSQSDDIKNNVLFDNIDDIFPGIGSPTIDYNASDDLDGTNAVDISPGATEADDWDDCFVDYLNGDLRPKGASVLVAAGIGSGTDANVPTTDIIGASRSSTTPTIGAFEKAVHVFTSVQDLMINQSLETVIFVAHEFTSVQSLSLDQSLESVIVDSNTAKDLEIELNLDAVTIVYDHILSPADLALSITIDEVIDIDYLLQSLSLDSPTMASVYVLSPSDMTISQSLEPVIGFAEDSGLTRFQQLLTQPTSKREFLIHLRPFKLDS